MKWSELLSYNDVLKISVTCACTPPCHSAWSCSHIRHLEASQDSNCYHVAPYIVEILEQKHQCSRSTGSAIADVAKREREREAGAVYFHSVIWYMIATNGQWHGTIFTLTTALLPILVLRYKLCCCCCCCSSPVLFHFISSSHLCKDVALWTQRSLRHQRHTR